MGFTDEELSRILSAHVNGEMQRFGKGGVCVAQAACGVSEQSDGLWTEPEPERETFMNNASIWFDREYKPDWTTDEFLAQLEAQGWA